MLLQAAMEAGRRLREEQYAALKDKEWEDTLRREADMHRSAAGSREVKGSLYMVGWSHAHNDRSCQLVASL